MPRLASKDYKEYFQKGISFEEYIKNFQEQLKDDSYEYAKYLPMNWQRMSRLIKSFEVEKEFADKLKTLTEPQKWIVITEHWCGDASQSVPVIEKIAQESNGLIIAVYVYRDQNEDLINAHLTDGGKSIPKIVALNDSFDMLWEWGPRPEAAQKVRKEILADPEKAPNVIDEIHLWYGRNRQKDIQVEISELIFLIIKDKKNK